MLGEFQPSAQVLEVPILVIIRLPIIAITRYRNILPSSKSQNKANPIRMATTKKRKKDIVYLKFKATERRRFCLI
tara:strand:+ start:290 stop:514 length:225 start_codon:yes stop_codon:yes gene_type:complete